MQLHPHEHLTIGCLRICAIAAAIVLCATAAALFVAWRQTSSLEPPLGYLGSPKHGQALLSHYGCPACHLIPGASPEGMVGPPLTGIANRTYIAGRIPNKPIEMQQWLQHPQTMKPGTAMPDLNVTERDARDIASYLATLK